MKNTIYIILSMIFITIMSFNVHVMNVRAADPPTFKGGLNVLKEKIAGPDASISEASATEILTNMIQWLLGLVAVLALMSIIIGGIMYILSIGNENMAAKAKKAILYAIIGLLVVGLSFAIISVVETFLTGS